MARGARTQPGWAAGLVPRPRLVDSIRSTPHAGTCLLLSEPGYGRGTVLAHAVGARAATVTLPPRPVDDTAWRDLLVEALAIEGEYDGPAALRRTEAEWLVVRDVDPDVHADLLPSLLAIATECPSTLRLAVTSSCDLRSRFDRLRQAGRVVELDADDLALAVEESRALLRDRAPELDDAIVDEVVALCDGWTAALLAAARQGQSHRAGDLLTWLRTQGAERAFGPWLDRLDPATYDMLLDTAMLDQLHPGLVDAVCGSGGQSLAGLASPGGALRVASSPLTREGVWFVRHPLLTSALRYLAGGRPAEAQRHRAAADWFLEHGVTREELAHRLLAGDAAAAVDRLHRHENELFESGMAHMALRWYQALPQDGLAPQDLLREAWAFALSDRPVEAHRSLDRLRLAVRSESRSHASVHPELRDLDAEADVLAAWLAEYDGDLVRVISHAARAQARFGTAWSSNSHQIAPLLHARAALNLGDVATAQRILTALRDEPFLSASIGEGRRTATLAELAWARGEVVRARSLAARHERWLRDQGSEGRPHRSGGGLITAHLVRAEAGDVESAVAGLRSLVDHARRVSGSLTEEVLARLALASVLGTQRGPREGLQQLEPARSAVLERAPDGGLLPAIVTREARLRLAAGDPRRAEQLLRGLPPGTSRQLLLARVALQRRLPSAQASVRSLAPTTPREEATHAVLLAWAALPTSRDRAEQQLLRAADICAEHGMTTLLVDVPEPLLEAARRTASYHVHEPLLTLLSHADRVRTRGGSRVAVASTASLEAALSRGDLQLLALLPTRDTNGRIAEQLGVSVNTIKTRLRRLYAKLDAHDRDEAVAHARAAGLLPDSPDALPD